MGLTITEKILAAHASKDKVTPGETIWVDVDVLMTHDVCGPGTISIFKEQFGKMQKCLIGKKSLSFPITIFSPQINMPTAT